MGSSGRKPTLSADSGVQDPSTGTVMKSAEPQRKCPKYTKEYVGEAGANVERATFALG